MQLENKCVKQGSVLHHNLSRSNCINNEDLFFIFPSSSEYVKGAYTNNRDSKFLPSTSKPCRIFTEACCYPQHNSYGVFRKSETTGDIGFLTTAVTNHAQYVNLLLHLISDCNLHTAELLPHARLYSVPPPTQTYGIYRILTVLINFLSVHKRPRETAGC